MEEAERCLCEPDGQLGWLGAIARLTAAVQTLPRRDQSNRSECRRERSDTTTFHPLSPYSTSRPFRTAVEELPTTPPTSTRSRRLAPAPGQRSRRPHSLQHAPSPPPGRPAYGPVPFLNGDNTHLLLLSSITTLTVKPAFPRPARRPPPPTRLPRAAEAPTRTGNAYLPSSLRSRSHGSRKLLRPRESHLQLQRRPTAARTQAVEPPLSV